MVARKQMLTQLCRSRRRSGGKLVLSAGITFHAVEHAVWSGAMNPSSDGAAMPSFSYHLPVLVDEIVEGLSVTRGGVYLDGTLGDGGHSLAILQRMAKLSSSEEATGQIETHQAAPGLVLGIDLDGRTVAEAARRLEDFGLAFQAAQGNYADMVSLAAREGVWQVDGVLLDLGFSSRQVNRPGYGLSFQTDEPLDMRYDQTQTITAAHLVNESSEAELADLFRRLGEEPRARAFARAIARERSAGPIRTTGELANLAERIVGRKRTHRIHPATRVFQGLRIAVNRELENLQAGLESAVALLRPGGRLAVISYHSLEDRIVKNFLAHRSAICVCPPGLPECVCGQTPDLAIVNRRIIRPSGEEVAFNPRSRSARLRLARRTQSDL